VIVQIYECVTKEALKEDRWAHSPYRYFLTDFRLRNISNSSTIPSSTTILAISGIQGEDKSSDYDYLLSYQGNDYYVPIEGFYLYYTGGDVTIDDERWKERIT
jgi:hypothetical protein